MAILFVMAKPAVKVRSLMIMFSALVTEVPVVLVLKCGAGSVGASDVAGDD
jgi:hypothetical protein